MNKVLLLIGFCCLGSVIAIGCNRPAWQFETAPVTGKVLVDGKPLTRGNVLFVPNQGRAASADIRTDGTFALSTYAESDGATVGIHKVAIHAIAGDEGTVLNPEVSTEIKTPLIPARYSNHDQSGIQFDVKADEKND